MAIVMTISVPFVRTAIDSPSGMKGAFKVLDDTCKAARAMAILQQTTVELRIQSDGSLQIVPVICWGPRSRVGIVHSAGLALQNW